MITIDDVERLASAAGLRRRDAGGNPSASVGAVHRRSEPSMPRLHAATDVAPSVRRRRLLPISPDLAAAVISDRVSPRQPPPRPPPPSRLTPPTTVRSTAAEPFDYRDRLPPVDRLNLSDVDSDESADRRAASAARRRRSVASRPPPSDRQEPPSRRHPSSERHDSSSGYDDYSDSRHRRRRDVQSSRDHNRGSNNSCEPPES